METIKPVNIFIAESGKLYVKMLDYFFSRDISYRFHGFNTAADLQANLSLRPDLLIIDPKLADGTDVFNKIKEQQHNPFIILLIKDQQEKAAAQLTAHDYHFEHEPLEQLTAKTDHFLKKIRESGRQ
jgi:DNA-binding response OmpR family regulator